MKISKIFLETIVPITIGTFFLVGYFFINQKFFPEPKLESCETYSPGIAAYFTYLLCIAAVCGFYQIVVGNSILKRNKNKFVLILVNSIVFGVFFTGILILINLWQRKTEWDFFPLFFLGLFLWALLFTALIKLWRRIFQHKFISK